jgi:NAD-dependent dihydropyrimidine dehydrogenase PreA subunit
MATKKLYAERRFLRAAERVLARLEALVDRVIPPALNPLYHLGTLSIFLLLVITVTGVYLGIGYKPNPSEAYASVAGMSASWLGSLVRTVHRYASDALVVMLVLHALKMLLSDRFWGSRWLAWVSGWTMVAIIWFIGVLGYWLVWDQRAQWLAEYAAGLIGGQVALTFATPVGIGQTATFFLIVLFLHVFIPLLLAGGIVVHMMRVARPRLWAPGGLLVGITAALVLTALWRPATSAAPADPARLVTSVRLDGWYLGFLPLADSALAPVFWVAAVAVGAGLLLLPRLGRGRHVGPAEIVPENCTGCTVCAEDCPFGAIEMQPRTDGGRYELIAVINPNLCTGCGLCVGSCATGGVELQAMPTWLVQGQLSAALRSVPPPAPGREPLVIFTCQRHTSLGSLPPGQQLADAPTDAAGAVVALPPGYPVTLGTLPGGTPTVTCTVPCVGMVQPEWLRAALGQGGRAVALLGCHTDDGATREGQRRAERRLGQRKNLTQRGVYRLEVTAGDPPAVIRLLEEIADGRRAPADNGGPVLTAPQPHMLVAALASVTLLILTLLVSLALDRPASATSADQARVRLALAHPGILKEDDSSETEAHGSEASDISEGGAPVLPLLGGERLPVRIRLDVDGAQVMEREYDPGGLHRDGAAYGLEEWSVPPGKHQIRVLIMDDDEHWRVGFDAAVSVSAGQVAILAYDADARVFRLP